MRTVLEPRIRRVVAERLGVDSGDLTPELSLVDDLAADSLDIVETLLALENDLDIAIPQPCVDRIRTYRDLVDTVIALTQDQHQTGGLKLGPPLFVRVRLLSAKTGASQGLLCADWLTPYVAETITEGALRAGRGARLELTFPRETTQAELEMVELQFAWLRERDVDLSIHRERDPQQTKRLPRSA